MKVVWYCAENLTDWALAYDKLCFRLYFYTEGISIEVKYKNRVMKTFYRISTQELGTEMLRRRKIAKALRWWLRENGKDYKYVFFVS
jgi:hypothetical protein